nr:MAG TPA: hypothetical protein [Caudoviricetes sp.]
MYLIFVYIFLLPVKSKQSLKEVLLIFVFFMFVYVKVLSVI